MLAIDIGNSRIKWAMFQGNVILVHDVFEYTNENFEEYLNQAGMPIIGQSVAISHVGSEDLSVRLVSWLNIKKCHSLFFAQAKAEQCHIVNSYNEPARLGVDRWLAMIAAYAHPVRKPAEAICVIDCGTAITFDVVSPEGQHLGGLIMPGLHTMHDSLSANTANLKKIAKPLSPAILEPALATSTAKAIELGCAQLVSEGLSAIINKYNNNLSIAMCCLITGGDGRWLSTELGYTNTYEPFLVLQGLQQVALDGAEFDNRFE